MKISMTVFQPANHPLIYRFPAHQRSAMRARTYEDPDLFYRAVKFVPALDFLIQEPGAGRRKVVLLGCLDKPWSRRGQFHEIRIIQSLREYVGEAHLRPGIAASKQQSVRIGKTCRNDYLEPRVQCPDECRQCSATGAAGRPDAFRVYIRPACQVVERSPGVPYEVASGALTDKVALRFRMDMLIGRPSG